MNRRHLLTLAPAALAGCAAPVQAACSMPVETPIMALYRRYAEINAASEAYVYDPADGDDEDLVVDLLFLNERDAIEEQLMALPAVTAQDLAAKALVSHCHGDFTCLPYDRDPFWIEARALVGAAA